MQITKIYQIIYFNFNSGNGLMYEVTSIFGNSKRARIDICVLRLLIKNPNFS